MAKYVGLEEEVTAYGTEEGDGAGSGTPIYFKILSESMETTREDFFPETTEFWTPDVKAEGFFRSGGDMSGLIDPVQFPKLLVFFMGDGTPVNIDDTTYVHTWGFGGSETVAATGIKPFTYFKGTGIEKDRMFEGCYIQSMSFEAINREPASYTATIVGNGHETTLNAKSPSYAAYTQPYLTFASAGLMEIGEVDRLTTAPTIEAFRLNLNRGYDTDHYVLGNKYLSAQTPSGMCTVDGTLDLSWTSQDEHERFLTAVAGTETGNQASFPIYLRLDGAISSGIHKYFVKWYLRECYYTTSTASVSGRDRIIQTVGFRANYNSTDSAACEMEVQNITTSYASLS